MHFSPLDVMRPVGVSLQSCFRRKDLRRLTVSRAHIWALQLLPEVCGRDANTAWLIRFLLRRNACFRGLRESGVWTTHAPAQTRWLKRYTWAAAENTSRSVSRTQSVFFHRMYELIPCLVLCFVSGVYACTYWHVGNLLAFPARHRISSDNTFHPQALSQILWTPRLAATTRLAGGAPLFLRIQGCPAPRSN